MVTETSRIKAGPHRNHPPREVVPCPLCSEKVHRTVFVKSTFVLSCCASCEFVFVNPRPTPEELKAIYFELGEHYFRDERQVKTDFDAARYDVEIDYLKRVTDGVGHELLDVGCATGSFLRIARDRGYRVRGVEYSAPSVAYCREVEHLDVLCANFLDHPFEPASFDIVTMWASLEHFREPLPYLHEAARVLRPGGALVVSVPNSAGVAARVLGARYRYVCIEHLNYFTPVTIAGALGRAGFNRVHTATRKFNPIVIRRDLQGFDDSISSHIDHNEHMLKLKTGPRFGLIRAAHGLVERALGRVRLGDILLASGRNP